MKKILVTVLSVILLVFMGTTNVYAAGYEAKIGSTEYPTLQDAINAVINGEEIIVIDDITCSTPITINNGNTFTINFKDGSTQHTFRWYDMMGTQTDKDIFTISNNSNVTVKDMKYLIGMGECGNRIFKVNSTGTLTLKDMVCASTDNIKDTPVVNNGGTVTIDGGDIAITNDGTHSILNPVVQNLGGTTTITGNGTYTTQSQTGVAWIGRVITHYSQSTDTDRDSECGTIIIENGTFNGGQILDVNGKANITINDATTGTQAGPTIKTFHGGIKSKITINNITSSTTVFSQVIEELETKIDFQNGNVKYNPNMFCVGSLASIIMNSVSIKNGIFGPSSGSTDIHDEINNLLFSGATLTALTSDPNGYTYEVVGPVCMIGSTGYATLDAALATVTSGQTITMLKDISYTDGTNFVIDGKTVTIDFNDKTMTVNANSMPTVTKLFTVSNSGNLIINNGKFDLTGVGLFSSPISSFIVSGSGSKLTLNNVTQASNLTKFLTLDGGSATINGGIFGTSNTDAKITLKNNATLTLTNNPTFNCQGGLITVGDTSNTDPDTLAANVIIDSGMFTATNTVRIIDLYAKANVTINGGTFTSPSNISAPIYIRNSGYKSNVTINNFTSNSPYVFWSNNNSNIESFTTTVNNGHYKYNKGQFAIDTGNGKSPKIKLNGGYYGPNTADDDALAELTAFLSSGKNIEELDTTDSEYVNGYRYKVYGNSPASDPTSGSTTRYIVPNTGVGGIYSNSHMLLSISSLSLLTIGTYMVIKKKEK